MKRDQKIKFSVLFLCFIFLLPVLSAKAAISAAEEWVDIPVVVNIIDASDANNVDAAIKKANKILAQAHIRLIVKKTNKNVNVGNNDGNLTAAEGNTAQNDGKTELQKVAGAGKGIKITIADDVWTESSATNGWSVHRNPVVFAETDSDPNTVGNIIAHEIGHSLTINGHSTDPNNVMYPSTPRGVNWDPNDVNEIFGNAKKRGRAYFIVPRTLGPVMIPAGLDYSIDAHGAILDDFHDLQIDDFLGTVDDPNEPSIQYADLREITLFADEPLDTNHTATLEIQLGGPPPDFEVDSFFDVFFDIDPTSPDPEAVIFIDVPAFGPPMAVHQQIIGSSDGYYEYGPGTILPPPIIHENQKFDGSTLVVDNRSLEVTLPMEHLSLGLRSVEPITISGQSFVVDFRNGPDSPIFLEDFVAPFEFDFTNPHQGPGISFIPSGISGFGFAGDSGVGIELDGEMFDSTVTKSDGTFMYFLDPLVALEPGLHSVIVKETDDSGPAGANYAVGYFNYFPEGEVVGNSN